MSTETARSLEEMKQRAEFELWRKAGSNKYIDPLTHGVMRDPVEAADGYTYDKASLDKWFEEAKGRGEGPVSPITRVPLSTADYNANVALKTEIDARVVELSVSAGTAIGAEIVANMPEPEVATIRELNSIFAHLDPIRSVLQSTLVDFSPPQIVVIGQESSGKSTLLERISMMSIFPRLEQDGAVDVSTCTRVRIEVELRNSESNEIPTIQVIDSLSREPIEGFKEPILVPATNGHVDVRKAMNDLISKIQDADEDTYVTAQIIKLTVKGPQVPSIDIVDLPGMRNAGDGVQVTRKMVDEHVESSVGRSLFLFVMKAGEIKANYTALAVAKAQSERHPELLDNSIGVFTMFDWLASGKPVNQTLERVVLPDDSVDFTKHGWIATMNAPPLKEDGSPRARGVETGFEILQLQAANELDYFGRTIDAWKPALAVDTQRLQELKLKLAAKCTTNNLIGKLNSMFISYLKDSWMPKAVKELISAKERTEYSIFINGVITSGPSTEKDAIAGREVELRLSKVLGPMQEAFNAHVLHDYRRHLEAVFLCFNDSLGGEDDGTFIKVEIDNQTVEEMLDNLRKQLQDATNSALLKVPLHWTEKVYETICAEAVEEVDSEAQFGVSFSVAGLIAGASWFGKYASKMLLFREIKKNKTAIPLIQLSNYPDYTRAIRAKCELIVQGLAKRMKENSAFMISRMFSLDSPWMCFAPNPQCSKISVKINHVQFKDAIIASLARVCPPGAVFLKLHEDISVGPEKDEAREKLGALNKELGDVTKALSAIEVAFGVEAERKAELADQVEW